MQFLIFVSLLAAVTARTIEFNLDSIIPELNINSIGEATKYSWTNCGDNSDVLVIKDIIVIPETPASFKEMTVKLEAYVNETPSPTATVSYLVKRGITLAKGSGKFCEFLKEVPDVPQCPLPSGPLTISITKKLPFVPKGEYTVQLRGESDGKRMLCIDGKMSFQ